MLIKEADICQVTHLVKSDWIINDATDLHEKNPHKAGKLSVS